MVEDLLKVTKLLTKERFKRAIEGMRYPYRGWCSYNDGKHPCNCAATDKNNTLAEILEVIEKL